MKHFPNVIGFSGFTLFISVPNETAPVSIFRPIYIAFPSFCNMAICFNRQKQEMKLKEIFQYKHMVLCIVLFVTLSYCRTRDIYNSFANYLAVGLPCIKTALLSL